MGDQIDLAAFTSSSDVGDAAHRARFPLPLDSEEDHAQVVRNRAPLNSADAQSDPGLPATQHESARLRGYRSFVVVPLLRHDEAIGTLGVARVEPGGFTDDEIALLQTFADQTVIAIENVRLFTELQAKNQALTEAHAQVSEALEQQTATGEILRVISRSQTDVQPVFDTLVASAVRLCRAHIGAVWQFDGERLHLVAHHNFTPEVLDVVSRGHPRRPQRDRVSGRAILSRAVVQIEDVLADREFDQDVALTTGWRSMVAVPMLREGHPIGAIVINRIEPGPFSDNQIELLRTFADQAVIAIENVRLFKELEARTQDLTRSVDELRALGEVGQAISSTLNLDTVLSTIVSRAVQLSGLDGGVVFEYDDAADEFVQRVATETGGALAEARRTTRVRKGEGALGRTAITLEPVQVPDITIPGAYESRLRENLIESGIRAILAVPMARENRLIGCLVGTRNHTG